jgi:hypothetical protein
MNKNKINWSELCDIIDGHVDCAESFTLLCDRELTEKILEYWEDCEFEHEYISVNNSDEYIVSIFCHDDEVDFGVEPLKTKTGKIKGHETGDLFIFIDTDEDEIEKQIECVTLSYCELVEDDNFEEDDEDFEDICNTEKCPRCSMIAEMASDIWDADDEEDVFEILKDIINMIEKAAFDEGYKACCNAQIEVLERVVDDIEDED